MNIIRRKTEAWDPIDVLADLQSEMNRAFNRSLTSRPWGSDFNPSIDVHEESDHYVLQADLPGLSKDDFSISVQGSQVTLKGERKHEKESREKNVHYAERFYGGFTRTLEFPSEIEADKVKASYKNGVLEVTLPKSEKSKPKTIQIEVK